MWAHFGVQNMGPLLVATGGDGPRNGPVFRPLKWSHFLGPWFPEIGGQWATKTKAAFWNFGARRGRRETTSELTLDVDLQGTLPKTISK